MHLIIMHARCCRLLQITGGDPMQLAGNITLCARSDLPSGRSLSGSLSNLMLFGQALTAGQVAALYRDYVEQVGLHWQC